VAPESAPRRPRGARKDGEPRAHAVDDEVVVKAVHGGASGARPGDDRDLVAPRNPARHLPVQVRAGPPALRARPVASGQQQDVHAPGDDIAGTGDRGPTMPRVKRRLPTAAALLTALALTVSTPAAMAQSAGGDQYFDPLAGTHSSSKGKQHSSTDTTAATTPSTASAAPPVNLPSTTPSTSTTSSGTSNSGSSTLPRTRPHERWLVAIA